MAPGLNYANYANYANYYPQSDQQQQQQRPRGQAYSNYSNLAATMAPAVSASAPYHLLTGQTLEQRSTYPTLSERYTYNAQALDGHETWQTRAQNSAYPVQSGRYTYGAPTADDYRTYSRSNFDTHSNFALTANPQYHPSTSSSNYGQYQALQAQRMSLSSPAHPPRAYNSSVSSAQQRRQTTQESANTIPASHNTISPQSTHDSTSATAAAQQYTPSPKLPPATPQPELYSAKSATESNSNEAQAPSSLPRAPQSQPSSAKPARDSKSSKVRPRNALPPAPVKKQDLARKRTFAELIDLTQPGYFSDNEREPPLAKKQPTVELNPTKPPSPPATTIATSPPTAAQQLLPPSPPSLQTSPRPATAVASSNTILHYVDPRAHQTNPVQPETPAQRTPIPEHPTLTVKMISPLNKYKALRRSTYNSKTIARDVLIACGRHPDMRHLNAHLELLKSAFPEIDNNSDLSTFRWDVVDPGGPSPGSGVFEPARQNVTVLEEADADGEYSDNDSVVGDAESRVRLATGQAIGIGGDLDAIDSTPAFLPRGKSSKPLSRRDQSRGRFSGHHAPGIQVRPGDTEPNPPRRSEGDPSSRAESSTTHMTYAELRARAEAEQRARGEEPPKKKGRPVGWRKWMQKTPGPNQPPTTARIKKPSPEPKYEVYKCEWKGCVAKLHNLATLRRHLYKVHFKPNSAGEYPCEWFQCGKVIAIIEPTTRRTTAKFVLEEFPSLEPWKTHVENKHLTPIAWKLGDGPKGGLTDNYESEVSDSYMSDSQGRRVTPLVVVAETTESTPSNNANTHPKRRAADEEAEAEQQAEQNRKRDIGPAVDRQGATLANAKRRQGFMDDEDIAEVIDEED